MNTTAIFLLTAAMLLGACSRDTAESPPPPPAAAADMSVGKAVIEAKCASCHGLDGQGSAPDIPHLTGQKQAYLLAAMDDYKTGKRAHAALEQLITGLSEAQTAGVAAYYAAQRVATAAASGPSPDTLAAGKSLAHACAACHGADGNAVLKGTPSLAGQHPAYLVAAMRAYHEKTRDHALMAAQTARLDTAAMESLAAYYAAQAPLGRGPASKGDAALGEPLSGKCGGCHGLKGHSGDTKTPSLAGQDADYLLTALRAYRDGSRSHEAMRAAVAVAHDTDLQHLAAFYAAQAPQRAAEQATPTHELASLCDKCHGPGAANPAMVVPLLEGQSAVYMVSALKAYREGKRPQSAMHAMGMPLSDADIQSIAAYYAALPPR